MAASGPDGADGGRATFLEALHALQSSESTDEQRKGANDWLMQFQRSESSWSVSKQLLLDQSMPGDVQLFAAQTLKSRARLLKTAPADQCQQMQHDVLSMMTQSSSHASLQLTKQLCLALVDTSLPCGATLDQLISHLTTSLPSTTALLTLEYLAEEVTSMTHFGSGEWPVLSACIHACMGRQASNHRQDS
jgi:hypothetical protein